jgi:hypothetical protein
VRPATIRRRGQPGARRTAGSPRQQPPEAMRPGSSAEPLIVRGR